MFTLESPLAGWERQKRVKADSLIGISRNWADPKRFKEITKTPPGRIRPCLEVLKGDLAFNIKFERCKLGMPESVACFLFDILPEFYKLVEEGGVLPSQAQIFRMLAVGFNLGVSSNRVVSDNSIFAVTEMEYRLLRAIPLLSEHRRRLVFIRFDSLLRDINPDVFECDRGKILRTIWFDNFSEVSDVCDSA